MATKSVGVRELKEQAPKLVQRAEHGEQVLITRHGKTVAVLGPATLANRGKPAERARFRAWEQERSAFQRLEPQLSPRLRGRFVAVHEGKVIASGSDPGRLAERVARRLPNSPFFIGRVGDPEPIVDMPGFTAQ